MSPYCERKGKGERGREKGEGVQKESMALLILPESTINLPTAFMVVPIH